MGHAAGKEEMLMLVRVKILAMEWMIRSAIQIITERDPVPYKV